MTSATNSPRGGVTVLQLEARKGYALGLNFLTSTNRPIDLTGCSIDFVMKPNARNYADDDDEANLITNSVAVIDDPLTGFARFNLQATDLNVAPGVYPFVINLTTAQNYPIIAVKGEIDVLNNPSTGSLDEVYPDSLPVTTLDVILRSQNVMKIRMGNNVPPGYDYISVEDQGKLDDIIMLLFGGDPLGTAAFKDVDFFAVAAAGTPNGGATHAALVKLSSADQHKGWVALDSLVPPPGTYMDVIDHGEYTEIIFTPSDAPGLDAAGTDEGMVPRAAGADLWGWEHLSADDVQDGSTHVSMTVEEREKLESIDPGLAGSDWAALEDEPGYIANKPELGTAAAEDVEAFRSAEWTPSLLELSDVDYGPELPESGPPGTFFIVLPGGE